MTSVAREGGIGVLERPGEVASCGREVCAGEVRRVLPPRVPRSLREQRLGLGGISAVSPHEAEQVVRLAARRVCVVAGGSADGGSQVSLGLVELPAIAGPAPQRDVRSKV
jgi:hypothetical protein